MNTFISFGLGLAAVITLLAIAVASLLRPLASSLQELCGTPERGNFWTTLSGLLLTVGTLLLGLLGFWWGQVRPAAAPGQGSGSTEILFWSALGMVQWAMAGLLLGLSMIAVIVLAFTVRLARGILPPPPSQPPL